MSAARMSRRALLASASAALALAGCGGGGPVPHDSFYRLGAAAQPAPLPGGPVQGTVEVPPFRAEGIINERAILYRDGPHELAQYSYHAWLEPPSVMIQRAFIDALRNAQAFTLVASPDMRLDRDYELMGVIRRWEEVTGSAPAAAVSLDISLRRVRDNRELTSRVYSVEEPARGEDVSAVVDAFTSGLDKLIGQFLGDLATVPKQAIAGR